MENVELDVALEELENRLERLRALYEQYFMGIERIEPAIPRKDIDRRIYVLRREKIRNTAKRFKLQTIISRYNTFQQYWQRICREIEHGTYRRHVIRAERIAPGQMLTIAARKRLGRHAFEEAKLDSTPPRALGNARPSLAASPSAPKSSPKPSGAPRESQAPRPPAENSHAKALPPAKPATRPAKPQPKPSESQFESLDLDLKMLGDWDPAQLKGARPPAVPARAPVQALARPLGAAPITGLSLRAPPTRAPPPFPSLPASRAALSRTSDAVVGASTAPSRASAPGAPPRRAPAPAPLSSAPRPTAALSPPRPLTRASREVTPAAVQPVGPNAPPTKLPTLSATASPAASANAVAPPKPAAPPARVKAAPPAQLLGDDRVRALHARLVEAKRQTQDGTAVSVESLAKSLQATEAKLREQHKNRTIEFDVVIKDGRALVKPIVR